MEIFMTVHDALLDFLMRGWLDASLLQIVLYTLVMTHITIASVTIFLHRAQAHLALELVQGTYARYPTTGTPRTAASALGLRLGVPDQVRPVQGSRVPPVAPAGHQPWHGDPAWLRLEPAASSTRQGA